MRPLYPTYAKQWSDSVMAEVNALRYYAPAAWAEASPESAPDMSAVAYWFGKTLVDSLQDVPVGIIANAVGGATA
ncbi:MAG: sialate O-acetylesterase [Muribaculaceae bacterium]|nr:sialate O-acetylesterase [Muribaculaceae bacterium]